VELVLPAAGASVIMIISCCMLYAVCILSTIVCTIVVPPFVSRYTADGGFVRIPTSSSYFYSSTLT